MTKKNIRRAEADKREAETGMRQTLGGMIVKIAAGALFIAVALERDNGTWSISYFLTGVILGLSLIAWGLIPYLGARRKKKDEQMDRLERVLSVPLEKFGDQQSKEDDLEALEKKYLKK
ncbi:MAG: hypothetical protein IJJ75_04450 [Firmicutes bacterium]|nr:hypothetical protein [Bacillota bacterium]MBR0522423.1 hypothetical protein [Bacillota bacterium]